MLKTTYIVKFDISQQLFGKRVDWMLYANFDNNRFNNEIRQIGKLRWKKTDLESLISKSDCRNTPNEIFFNRG